MNFDIGNLGRKNIQLDLLLNCLNHELSWLREFQIQ